MVMMDVPCTAVTSEQAARPAREHADVMVPG
jgi:hypothetical protein